MTVSAPLRINGLPEHLACPPASPIGPDDPEWGAKLAAWEDWARGIMRHRVARREQLAKIPALIPIERRYCADPDTGPIYFGLMYGWIYEPRTNRRQSPDSPFIFYRFQIDMILWAMDIIDLDDPEGAEGDGVVSKSRDMGATWCFCLLALWGWLFAHPWQVRLISWRGDEVDANHPDAMFYKIRYMLAHLPAWMIPDGFTWDHHSNKNELINPANGNALVGQTSTERAMSGSRATWLLYDEAAKNKYFRESWGATTNVAEHRFAVSSEHLDYNTLFHQLSHRIDLAPDEQPQVYAVDYWLHPYHDEDWRRRQQKRNAAEPGAYEREVLRDPRGTDSVIVYPLALSKRVEPIERRPYAPIYVGIDPGSSDECAIVWLQDSDADGYMDVIQATMRSKQVADFHGTIIRGTPYFVPPNTRWALTDDEEQMIQMHDWAGLEALEGWTRCEESSGWEYTDEEYELMAWVRSIGQPVAFYGDVSGQSVVGVTKDTVYSRMLKFGILVNRDRLPTGGQTAFRAQARTYQGRQQATKAVLPRMRFNNNRGGRMVLRAFQEYRWSDPDKPRMNEPTKPLHDKSSHLVTACEYVFVQRRIMFDMIVAGMGGQKPEKAATGRRAYNTNHYARMGRRIAVK